MPAYLIRENFLLFWNTHSKKEEDLFSTLIRFNNYLQSLGFQKFAYAEDFDDVIENLVREGILTLQNGQYDKQIVAEVDS